MSLMVTGATLIDGVREHPIAGHAVWIEDGRIKAILSEGEVGAVEAARHIDARGKFLIPGLMNANVHLLGDARLEILARYGERFDELILEAAQVALKNGLTTVFDTWGPRRFLMSVRDKINQGTAIGSRIFCAGNIVGFDGPFSPDFYPKAAAVASPAFVSRINAIWTENVGRHLMWRTPEQVATEVRSYISRGIDFLKYGSNDHFPGSFLAFSEQVQAAIVAEARRAGLTAQAHTMSVEGLRVAIEAGSDLIQHANITGPAAIPAETLALMAKRQVGAVIFTVTECGLEWLATQASEQVRTSWRCMDINARNLIGSGAPLLFANDGGLFAPELSSDRAHTDFWNAICGDRGGGMYNLAEGHFSWFVAMEEKGCAPLQMLRAATCNIARAYGKDQELGTLEPGKIADMLILERNPLERAANYRSIATIIKNGEVVDTASLPTKPIFTAPMEIAPDEEARHIGFFSGATFPLCPSCRARCL